MCVFVLFVIVKSFCKNKKNWLHDLIDRIDSNDLIYITTRGND